MMNKELSFILNFVLFGMTGVELNMANVVYNVSSLQPRPAGRVRVVHVGVAGTGG